MGTEKEVEISLDKTYVLPKFQMIRFKGLYLAIAPEIARWLILKNDTQLKVLDKIVHQTPIACLLKDFKSSQEDVIEVLTQIEATQIETIKPKSIFNNTRLHLHLTNKCNMCCPHCYVCSNKAYDDELSTEEVKELCRNFREIGGTVVSLTGGEPTTRSDFLEIIDYISRLDMKVSIFSNGFLWGEEMILHLVKCNIDGVQISIDGYNEKSNSVFRTKGSFVRALKTVDLLVRNNIHVKIAVTAPYEVLKDNQRRYIAFSRKLLEKYGNDAIEINYSYYFMPGRNINENRIKNIKRDYYRLVDEVVSAIYPNVYESSFVANIVNSVYDSCGYGGLNVLANGDFYFCDRISDVCKIGNIRELPFAEIYRQMVLAEKAGKIDHFMPCRDCPVKYICGGGCRAEYFRNFTQMANIDHIDYEKIKPRKCMRKDRERIYNLMIKTYQRFYR